MRIIGGKDYYDSASSYGIDPMVVFLRDNRVISNQQLKDLGRPSNLHLSITEPLREVKDHWKNRDVPRVAADEHWNQRQQTLHGHLYVLTSHPVIFCGKVYLGLEIRDDTSHETFWFWHLDKLTRWAEERDLEVHSTLLWWQKERGLSDSFEPRILGESVIQELIHQRISIARLVGRETKPHYKTKADWLDQDSGWRANGVGLRDIGFQSALDPVTAFQELSMWVGGTLGGAAGQPVVEIQDDKVKLAKHGMDETSFRRPKQDSGDQ